MKRNYCQCVNKFIGILNNDKIVVIKSFARGFYVGQKIKATRFSFQRISRDKGDSCLIMANKDELKRIELALTTE
jgi:hypothetical protein